MIQYNRDGIYRLLLELCSVPSISASPEGENLAAAMIYSRLSELDYFRDHPEDLQLLPIEGDHLGRNIVTALVRAVPETIKTVIVTGHFDVVDTDVCGPLRDIAFDPEEYTRRIGEMPISEEARLDLESGNYLFGRGVADMKAGIAMEMALIADFSRKREELKGNLLFLAVPDEENTSAGMRGAVPYIARFQEEMGLDLLACINTEPTVTIDKVGSGSIYTGSIGKIMPFYLCVGKESHVGEYFEGISASLIASHLNILIEGNPSYSDMLGNRLFPPQTCLKIKDLRDSYSVTLPERAAAYYNCLTVSKTPAVVMEEMNSLASLALERTFLHLKNSAGCYRQMGQKNLPDYEIEPKVFTVKEIEEKARGKLGDNYLTALDDLISSFSEEDDERDRGIAILNWMIDVSGYKGPFAVIGFLPPYNPYRVNRRKSVRELVIIRTAEEMVDLARDRYEQEISIEEVFEGITDLSYVGFQGDRDDLEPIVENTPGWGKIYSLPVEELLCLDIPVMNIGPVGKDCHKNTERLDLASGLEIVPGLLSYAVQRICELNREV